MKDRLRVEIVNLALEFVINDEAKKRLLQIVDAAEDEPLPHHELFKHDGSMSKVMDILAEIGEQEEA